MKKKYIVNVNQKFAGLRLDIAVTKKIPSITRSNLKSHSTEIKVNDKNEKLSYKCRLGDKIYVELEWIDNSQILPENIPLEIIYEDDNYLIINKKYGMVIHPAKGNYTGTLVNALMGMKMKLSESNQDIFRPGIVHRLDKDTSGLVLVAKNNESHAYLSKLFKKRKIRKRYHAIVKGFFAPTKLEIINNIGRDKTNRKKMTVLNHGGKTAITQVKVLKHFDGYSYLNINLKTGRTHQIRVHLSNLGFPILGDIIYSRKDKNFTDIKLCLVAYRLSFYDKFTGKVLDFRIKNPKHFSQIYKKSNNK
jgi:23S rRNA pseudouridine1911/1915/1917 synthase